jgi:hypothetical protein
MPRTDAAPTNRHQVLVMSVPPPSHWRAVLGLLVAVGSACYLIADEPLEPSARAADIVAIRVLAKPL